MGKTCWCLGQNQSGRCGAPPAPPIDPSEFGSVTLIQVCLGDAKGLVPDYYNKYCSKAIHMNFLVYQRIYVMFILHCSPVSVQ